MFQRSRGSDHCVTERCHLINAILVEVNLPARGAHNADIQTHPMDALLISANTLFPDKNVEVQEDK